MRKVNLIILSILALPSLMIGQGNFIKKGESALSVGSGVGWGNSMTSISGSVIASLWGRIDVGVSHGVLDNGDAGRGTSYILSYYLLRGKSGRSYVGLNCTYTVEQTYDPSGYWVYNKFLPKEIMRYGTSYTLSYGILFPQSNTWSFIAGIELGVMQITVPQFMIGVDLSLLIPILNSSELIASIGYGHVVESAHVFGIDITYLYKFNL